MLVFLAGSSSITLPMTVRETGRPHAGTLQVFFSANSRLIGQSPVFASKLNSSRLSFSPLQPHVISERSLN